MMLQRRLSVVSSKNGSRMAVFGSGMRIMSDSLMPFHPAIEEPSNILPSVKRLFLHLVRGNRDVLFLAARIAETEIDVLDLLLFDDLQDVAGCRHGSSSEIVLASRSIGPSLMQAPCQRHEPL